MLEMWRYHCAVRASNVITPAKMKTPSADLGPEQRRLK